jgi:hypothetical protein
MVDFLSDIKKDDGFSALHLAALNGHKDVTNVLLTQVYFFYPSHMVVGFTTTYAISAYHH